MEKKKYIVPETTTYDIDMESLLNAMSCEFDGDNSIVFDQSGESDDDCDAKSHYSAWDEWN